MRTRPTADGMTDRDGLPLEVPCAACGLTGPVALLAYLDGTPVPYILCAACAGDREHLRALVRALSPALAMIETPQGTGRAA